MDPGGRLRSIAEVRQFRPGEGGKFIGLVSGSSREFSGDLLVSMNLWAFTPRSSFAEQSFAEFVASSPGPDQGLCCPRQLILSARADRGTSPSHQRYRLRSHHPEDKPQVAATLRGLVQAGHYPQVLWEAEDSPHPALPAIADSAYHENRQPGEELRQMAVEKTPSTEQR